MRILTTTEKILFVVLVLDAQVRLSGLKGEEIRTSVPYLKFSKELSLNDVIIILSRLEREGILKVLSERPDRLMRRETIYFELKTYPKLLAKRKEKLIREWKNESINLLVCGGLKFDPENGDAIYGKVETSFKPGTDEYRVLRLLLENPNKRVTPERLLNKTEASSSNKRDLVFVIRNIKAKLGIIGKKGKNKDLFRACNGYRVVCD